MQWKNKSIILSVKKYGETSVLLRVFSYEHGVYSGVMRGGNSSKKRGMLQAGNLVDATWQARLAEQLGSLSCELLEARAAFIMMDELRLCALSSLLALIELSLPERHPYPALYQSIDSFLQQLCHGQNWQVDYVFLEQKILAETGFGLDLSECAATGATEDLIYVSPKSGRAVCRDAGAPYHDKLLPLPEFLRPHPPLKEEGLEKQSQEILAGLRLTGYFLRAHLLEPHGKKLPAARVRLTELLHTHDGTTTTKTAS